jgi:tetratricopeptide (TPR) repeat protein
MSRRRTRKNQQSRGSAAPAQPNLAGVNRVTLLWNLLPFAVLIGSSLFAYANAWPDVAVHDDKFFAGSERFPPWTDIARIFSEDLWAASGVHSGLYRPMLMLSLALDADIYGDWLAGWHLSNLLLHAVATLFVYGLVNQVLRMTNGQDASPNRLYALLAALVFSVHPIHCETVNSIFNRSEILAAIGGAGGLWCLLRNLDAKPLLAWSGLGLGYLFALFSKESAVVIPGLAVALILLLRQHNWRSRLRSCLPALWLLLPLGLYLVLRGYALAPSEPAAALGTAGSGGAWSILSFIGLPDWRTFSTLAGVLGEALRLIAWPDRLSTFHNPPDRLWQISSLAFQLLVLGVALFAYRRNRRGWLAGLVFFYLAYLPASRLFAGSGEFPHLAERYLYFPSAGLLILLALGLRYVGQRWDRLAAAAPIVLALVLLTPLTWARNTDWADEISLFESDLRKVPGNPSLLRVLTGALLREGDYQRVVELCDANSSRSDRSGRYANHCAVAYGRLGHDEKAERAYRLAVNDEASRAVAHANLARYYLRLGRRNEAEEHFQLAVETEQDPARRAYRRGHMIARLYPSDRTRLLEARAHFEEALRLQPQMASARQWLDQIDRFLASN